MFMNGSGPPTQLKPLTSVTAVTQGFLATAGTACGWDCGIGCAALNCCGCVGGTGTALGVGLGAGLGTTTYTPLTGVTTEALGGVYGNNPLLSFGAEFLMGSRTGALIPGMAVRTKSNELIRCSLKPEELRNRANYEAHNPREWTPHVRHYEPPERD